MAIDAERDDVIQPVGVFFFMLVRLDECSNGNDVVDIWISTDLLS